MRNTSGSDKDDAEAVAERESKKRRIQMEILMLESDMRKLTNEKSTLDADIRKLGLDGERIRITLDDKKRRLAKVTQDKQVKEDELRVFRKKLNLL